MLRRGLSYHDGLAPDGKPDAGLLFLAWQADPAHGFIPVQQRLTRGMDALNRFIHHETSACSRWSGRRARVLPRPGRSWNPEPRRHRDVGHVIPAVTLRRRSATGGTGQAVLGPDGVQRSRHRRRHLRYHPSVIQMVPGDHRESRSRQGDPAHTLSESGQPPPGGRRQGCRSSPGGIRPR